MSDDDKTPPARNVMRAINLELPDDEEFRRIFRGVMLDNMGGVTVATNVPIRLGLHVGQIGELFNFPLGVSPGVMIRLECAPIAEIDAGTKSVAEMLKRNR